MARHNLGVASRLIAGNTDRALKALDDCSEGWDGSNSLHGHQTALYHKAMQQKRSTLKHYGYYQAYLDEIKSDQRDKAATLYVKSNYY